MENSGQVCVDKIITIDNLYRVNNTSFLTINKDETLWILLHTVKKNSHIDSFSKWMYFYGLSSARSYSRCSK